MRKWRAVKILFLPYTNILLSIKEKETSGALRAAYIVQSATKKVHQQKVACCFGQRWVARRSVLRTELRPFKMERVQQTLYK